MQLILELTPELAERLKEIASKDMVSVEDVAKAVLAGYVKAHMAKPRNPGWLLALPGILRNSADTIESSVAQKQAKKAE